MENDLRPCVVVLVEDEAVLRMIAAYAFEEVDFVVIEAASADEAIRILEDRPVVNLVFTDVTLPGLMDGFDLAHEVKQRWPHIGLLLTSGRPRPPGQLPLGCDFIPKPYGLDEMLSAARAVTAYGCGNRRGFAAHA